MPQVPEDPSHAVVAIRAVTRDRVARGCERREMGVDRPSPRLQLEQTPVLAPSAPRPRCVVDRRADVGRARVDGVLKEVEPQRAVGTLQATQCKSDASWSKSHELPESRMSRGSLDHRQLGRAELNVVRKIVKPPSLI